MKKRILSSITALALMFTMLPSSLFVTTAYAAEVDPSDPINSINNVINGGQVAITFGEEGDEDSGYIKLTKTAVSTGIPNEYEITLTVEGKDLVVRNPAAADIVLVMDTSGSMNYCTLPAHTHSSSCRATGVYDCGLENHTHNDDCYSAYDHEEHKAHTDDCYSAYTCDGLHTHSEAGTKFGVPGACYKFYCTSGHSWNRHTDSCFRRICGMTEHKTHNNCRTLLCDKDIHTHSSSCRDLLCTETVHTHTSSCQGYSCGLVEHTHQNSQTGRCAGENQRMYLAKQAANALLNALNASGADLNVALVTFASSTTTAIGLTDVTTAEGLAAVQAKVNAISQVGGTRPGPAFDAARALLNNDNGRQKYVIFIGDGEADSNTYRDAATTASGKVQGIPATVYTIGFGDADTGSFKLWASKDEDGNPLYFQATSGEALSAILAALGEEVIANVNTGAVVDPIPAGVSGVTITGDVANYDADTKTISWTPDEEKMLAEGGDSITYKVTIDSLLITDADANNSVMLALNGETTITYFDPIDEVDKSASFNVPQGQGTFTTISTVGRLVNANGDYINANGEVVEKENAYIVQSKTGVNNANAVNGGNQWGYGTYEIAAPAVDGFAVVAADAAQNVTTTAGNRNPVVEVRYTAEREIIFDANGGNWAGDTDDKEFTKNIGDAYPSVENPVKEGFTFVGWDKTVPSRNVALSDPATITYEAVWAEADVAYKVIHNTTDADGGNAVAHTTENKIGKTGADAVWGTITIPGYTYVPGSTTPNGDKKIAADGSLVINLYYAPNADTAYKVEHYLGDSVTAKDTDNLTGTTGDTATYAAKTYAGYTYNASKTTSNNEFIIAADGTLVIKLFYDANTNTAYKVEHYLVDANGEANLEDTDNLNGKTGAIATATAKTFDGYTLDTGYDGTLQSAAIAGDGSTVLKLFYVADTDTAYKVEHYIVSFDGTETLEETENLTGTTGTTVTATEKSYDGYTFDETYAGTLVSDTVAGDGSTVLKLFYVPSEDTEYTVNYYLEDTASEEGGWILQEAATETLAGTTGDQATYVKKTFSGYVYDHTSPADGNHTIAADGSLVISVYYTARTAIEYTVEYYLENTTDENVEWDLQSAATEVKTGKTGGPGVYTVKTFTGYTYDSSLTTPANKAILADGSLVIKLYYTADADTAYKVEHYLVNAAGTATLDDTEDFTGKTNTFATAVDKDYSAIGYTFAPNYTGTVASAVIAGDGSTVLKLFYTANTNIPYTVYHYTVEADGTTQNLKDTDNKTGATGAQGTYELNTYAGYTFSNATPAEGDRTITVDGNLVINVYYVASEVNYKIEHYTVEANGAATLKDTTVHSGVTGTVAGHEGKTKEYTGYALDLTYEGTVIGLTVAADGSTVLKLYYPAAEVIYTVNHYREVVGEDPDKIYFEASPILTQNNQPGITNTQVTVSNHIQASTGDFEGFVYAAAYTSKDITIKADGSLVVNMYYVAASNTEYNVKHYLQNADGGYTQEGDTELKVGKTNNTVNVANLVKTFPGYDYNEELTTPSLTPEIAADGSLVIELYYDIDETDVVTVNGTITYWLAEGDTKVQIGDAEAFSRDIWAGEAAQFQIGVGDTKLDEVYTSLGKETHYIQSQPVFPVTFTTQSENFDVIFAAKTVQESEIGIEHNYEAKYFLDGNQTNATTASTQNGSTATAGDTLNVNDFIVENYNGVNYNVDKGITVFRTQKELLVPITDDERAQFEADLAQVEADLEEAQADLDAAIAAADGAQDEIDRLNALIAELELELQDYTEVDAAIAAAQTAVAEQQAIVEDHVNAIAALQDTIDGYNNALTAYNTEKAAYDSELAAYETAKAAYEAYVALTEEEKQDTPEVADPGLAPVAPVEPALIDVAALNAEIAAIEALKDEAEIALGAAQADLDVAQEAKADLELIDEDTLEEIEEHKLAIADAQALLIAVETAQADVDGITAEKNALEKILDTGFVSTPTSGSGVEEPVSVDGSGNFAYEAGYSYRVVINRYYEKRDTTPKEEGGGGDTPPPPVVVIPETPVPRGTTPPSGYVIIDDNETPLGGLPNTSAGKSMAGAGLLALLAGAVARFKKKDENDEQPGE